MTEEGKGERELLEKELKRCNRNWEIFVITVIVFLTDRRVFSSTERERRGGGYCGRTSWFHSSQEKRRFKSLICHERM